MNLKRPRARMDGVASWLSEATMIRPTTRTAAPRTASAAFQMRSGRLPRGRGACGTSGPRTAIISLAGCKHGLPLHRHLLQGRLDLFHQALRKRGVVERGGALLSLVLRPPDELEQRVALFLVRHIAIDEQIGEGRDGPGVLAGLVGDGDAVVLGDRGLLRR